ncbi:MAG: SMP-30/gluconolactonase/LRE family protein [Firmicutes bacterium]|nr:SMP-30/gluconolactonase/LRE family protein [Bacillota bacterium]
MSNPMRSLSEVTLFADGLDHPECITVDPQGTLWAGGEAGQVYKINAQDGSYTIVGNTGGFLLGVTCDGQGRIWCCDSARHAVVVMDKETGKILHVIESVNNIRLENPNFASFDAQGWLYVTDSGHFGQNDGFLFAVQPNGIPMVIDDRCRFFPNGLALSPDGLSLYIAESTRPAITQLNLNTKQYDIVAQLPGTVPDGLAVDQAGTIYVGCYRPDAIIRIRNGKSETWLHDPQGVTLAAPTNLCFGGPRRSTLYIASLGRWHIGSIPMDIPGTELIYPNNGIIA